MMTTAEHTYGDNKLDTLFPVPSLPQTVLYPQRYSGSSPESVAALRYVLRDNHTKHHVFINDRKFHNHTAHRAAALYATGANGALIEHLYKQDSTGQLPAVTPPGMITEENFIEHLGDERFYAAYVTFFVGAVEEKGVSVALENYIFSDRYNLVEGRGSSGSMLIRLLGALFHAFIHVGYGIELDILGLVAEGLAMASVHDLEGPMFLPPSLFEHRTTTAANEAIMQLHNTKAIPSRLVRPSGNHAFSIIARVVQDPQFSSKKTEKYFDGSIHPLLTVHGTAIWRYAEQWTIDLSHPGEVERKMEECIWTITILYGIGGCSKGNGFRADFFLMHLVTSSLFLPVLVSHLSQDSQVILLRAYFALVLAWWISRGRPQPNIQGFLNAADPLSLSEREVPVEANPFLGIVQSGIMHPNDHMIKIQRALAHFSSLYGTRPKGYFMGTELDGAEVLDGSLFLKVAQLTDEYMGRGTRMWSFEAF